MLMPRRLTFFIIGVVAGVVVGGTLGYNYGRGAPLLTSPFSKKTLGEKIRHAGDRVFENTGRALEKSGRNLKNIFKN